MTKASITDQRPLLIHKSAQEELTEAGYLTRPQGDDWRIGFPNGEVVETDGEGLLLATHLLSKGPFTADQLIALAAPDPTASIAPILIPLTTLDDNPYQPRIDYDGERIGAIANSIREHGLLQAPIGRRMPDGRVQLAFGHSRLRAFRALAAGHERWGLMPVLLRPLDDETMALHAWTENRDRKDLSAYEEARAIQRYTTDFGWNQKQAAAKMQLDQSTISNKLRLLRLPEATLAQLQRGEISERQALALLPLMDLPPATRAATVRYWTGDGYIDNVDALLLAAGQYDSARLRNLVERMFERLTVPLASQAWYAETFEVVSPIRSATCKDCPIRLKATNRCPDQACAEGKKQTLDAQRARKAADSLGLKAVSRDQSYNAYSDPSGVTLKTLQAKAEEKGCGNLAVCEGGYSGIAVPGFPSCRVICVHGKGKRCGCVQSLARSPDPTVSEDARKRHDRQRIKAELLVPAEQALAEALARPTVGVWRSLLNEIDSSRESKLPKDADLATVRAALAECLTSRAVGYSLEQGRYDNAKGYLVQLLSKVGAPPPWAPDEPKDLRANIPTPVIELPAAALPADLCARVEALGLVVQALDGAWLLHWPREDLDQIEPLIALDTVREWLIDAAPGLAGQRIADGALELTGIAYAEDAVIEVPDYTYVAEVVGHLVAAEALGLEQMPPRSVAQLWSLLEGAADVLSDATYTDLATRITALERKESEVAA